MTGDRMTVARFRKLSIGYHWGRLYDNNFPRYISEIYGNYFLRNLYSLGIETLKLLPCGRNEHFGLGAWLILYNEYENYGFCV